MANMSTIDPKRQEMYNRLKNDKTLSLKEWVKLYKKLQKITEKKIDEHIKALKLMCGVDDNG